MTLMTFQYDIKIVIVTNHVTFTGNRTQNISLVKSRSVILMYHGYRHDFMSSDVLSSPEEDPPPSFDGGDGVTVGTGRRWTTLPSFLHDLGVMMNASFEEGFGVWGGKHSEIGKLGNKKV